MAQGYESWVRIRGNGAWTTKPTWDFGYYTDCEAEAFTHGQEVNERDNRIVFGRNSKPSSRSYANLNPNGNITIFPRTDDLIPLFKSHFQCWRFLGTVLTAAGSVWNGTGTFYFVPTPNEPDFGSGQSYGTMTGAGYETATKGNTYSVRLDVKYGDSVTGNNGVSYFMGLCDNLEFQLDAGDDLRLTPTLMFGSVTYPENFAGTANPNGGHGSYSTKDRLIAHAGTLTYTYGGAGTTLNITSLRITSQNQLRPNFRIGAQAPGDFHFGRNLVNGEFTLEYDDANFINTFKNNGSAALALEFRNANDDQILIECPLIKHAPFNPNVEAGDSTIETTIPFRAYMSENGGTPAIRLTLYSNWRQAGTLI